MKFGVLFNSNCTIGTCKLFLIHHNNLRVDPRNTKILPPKDSSHNFFSEYIPRTHGNFFFLNLFRYFFICFSKRFIFFFFLPVFTYQSFYQIQMDKVGFKLKKTKKQTKNNILRTTHEISKTTLSLFVYLHLIWVNTQIAPYLEADVLCF